MNEVAFSDFQEDPQDVATNLPATVKERRSTSLISPRTTLDFQVSGHGENKLLEMAMSLLGLAVRIRDMPNYSEVEALHSRVTNEIQNFQQEAEVLGYDDATILAARYMICAMLDESVLSQTWGAESLWPEHPMLSVFHNETWGGEKVFGILDRVIDEAHRFPDLLEFIYFCVVLGFEGKYHVMHNGQAKLDHLMEAVYRVVEKHHGEAPAKLVDPEPNIYGQKQRMNWRVPIWSILLVGIGALVTIHLYYDTRLTEEISGIATDIGASLSTDRLGE